MSRVQHTPAQTLPRVEYRTSPQLTGDEARRRRSLAFAWLLGLAPWPDAKAPKP